MSIWKIIFEGNTASDVHGVNLRESIHKVVCSINDKIDKKDILGTILDGSVRNIKTTTRVELVIKTENEKMIDLLITQLEKIPEKNILVDLKNSITLHKPFEIEDDSFKFNSFGVIREDELTEMVWALQAAGKVFYSQETIRENKQLRGLSFECNFIEDVVKNIEDGNKVRRFTIPLIETILREPSKKFNDSENPPIYSLYSLFEYCRLINNMLDSDELLQDIQPLLDEVKKSNKELIEKLKKIN